MVTDGGVGRTSMAGEPVMADTIHTEPVTYATGDTTLRGYLATDATKPGRRPGVLVAHEWWGLNDYIRRRARMLAELGYTALAVDMYGDGKVADNPGDAGTLMNAVLAQRQAAEDRFRAAYELLKSQPSVDPDRIAAIGYCFGGAVVLHAARIGMPLRGVVSFHGALGSFHTPAPGSVKAKILVCHGAADSLVSEAEVEAFKAEMDQAKADYRFVAYPNAPHGFTNPDTDAMAKKFGGFPIGYDADADRRSWENMTEFLARVFA
jgi:dienelactone hydrolase